jgi:two-component system chemotaxis sensor kinase CheA
VIELDDEALAEVRATFLPEAQELLERLLGALLQLDEAGGNSEEALSEIKRTLHTLKGASAAARFPTLRLLSHALEEVCTQDLTTIANRAFLFDGMDHITSSLPYLYDLSSSPPTPLLSLLERSPAPLPEALLSEAQDLQEVQKVPTPIASPEPPPPPASPPSADAPPIETDPEPSLPKEGPLSSQASTTGPRELDTGYFRVRSQDLDRLLEELGELLVSSGGLEMLSENLLADETTRRAGALMRRSIERLRRQISVCQDTGRSLRMVAAGSLLNPLRMMVKDVLGGREQHVNLVLRGGEIRLDRQIIEELRGILVHLIRNAVDHGLEDPFERRSEGKPEAGRIQVRFSLSSASIHVAIEDDGRGICPAELTQEAIRRGILSREEAQLLEEDQQLALIFSEGFTTRKAVTEYSGRGVGLSAVQERINSLGGNVRISSKQGKGTRFQLEIPLATTTISSLIVRVGRQTLALPMSSIERVVTATEVEHSDLLGVPCIQLREQRIGVRLLSEILGIPSIKTEGRLPYVIIAGSAGQLALQVDEVVQQREIVFRPLGPRFSCFELLSGATLLGSGEVVLILSPSALLAYMNRRQHLRAGQQAEDDLAEIPLILVADDSMTMLNMSSSILEGAGYKVVQARDGEAALVKLRETPGIDLVLTDVDMPRRDGLSLTREIKSSPATASIPVILLTANDDPQTRRQGMEAGADAYLVKGRIDRSSLTMAVERLL